MNEIQAVEGTIAAELLFRDPDQCHAIVYDIAKGGPCACGALTFHELITALIVVVQRQAVRIEELEGKSR
jgi:hypothetical protein